MQRSGCGVWDGSGIAGAKPHSCLKQQCLRATLCCVKQRYLKAAEFIIPEFYGVHGERVCGQGAAWLLRVAAAALLSELYRSGMVSSQGIELFGFVLFCELNVGLVQFTNGE